MKNSYCARYALKLFLMMGLALVIVLGASAQEIRSTSDFAILIVGDESDPEMLRREKALIQEMAKSLKKQNKVAIYSYHFNKERERTYCEKKLSILKEDILFIGIVSLKDRVPRKVLYRLDRIVSPGRSASDVLSRADEMVAALNGPSAPESPSAPTTPAPAETPTGGTSKTVEAGRWRVQLGVFAQNKSAQDLVDQLKAKGYDARIDRVSSDNAQVFKVWVGTFATKEDAQQTITELQADGFEKGFAVEAK